VVPLDPLGSRSVQQPEPHDLPHNLVVSYPKDGAALAVDSRPEDPWGGPQETAGSGCGRVLRSGEHEEDWGLRRQGSEEPVSACVAAGMLARGKAPHGAPMDLEADAPDRCLEAYGPSGRSFEAGNPQGNHTADALGRGPEAYARSASSEPGAPRGDLTADAPDGGLEADAPETDLGPDTEGDWFTALARKLANHEEVEVSAYVTNLPLISIIIVSCPMLRPGDRWLAGDWWLVCNSAIQLANKQELEVHHAEIHVIS
jgi:hypothetical protein